MAVPEQTPYIEHTGNGVTTSFSLKFQCESKDHLIVLVDEIEPPIETWSLTGGNVVFTTAPAAGKQITLQRNTPFSRTTDYQSYNNSFRPPVVNKDFDWIWLKLQELGVADWILSVRIDALKNYVDRKDDELKAYLMEEIRKQGVALDQLDEYYNYLMQRLAQIAVDKGWDASFVVYEGKNLQGVLEQQENLNAAQAERNKDQINARDWGILPSNSPQTNYENMFALLNAFPEREALDIFVPAGTYNFSKGFYITRPHRITGVGKKEKCATKFDFQGSTPVGTVNYKASIFIPHWQTIQDASGDGLILPSGQVGIDGTDSSITGIKVLNSPAHGVIKNAPCYFTSSMVEGSALHGVLTIANTGAGWPRISGIANQGSNYNSACLRNGKSGFVEIGSDANIVDNSNTVSAFNEEYGWYDGSLLGGNSSNMHCLGNTLADFCQQGSPADNSGLPETPSRTVLIAPYAEAQRPQAFSMNARSLVVGATGAQPEISHCPNSLLSSIVGLLTGSAISAATDANHVYAGKGADFISINPSALRMGFTESPNASFEITEYIAGRLGFKVNGDKYPIVALLSDFSNTLKTGRLWMPEGFVMGNTHYQTAGTAAPTTGTWDRGNIVWNESPTAGGKIGWVCVTGGIPGVWRPFGAIDA